MTAQEIHDLLQRIIDNLEAVADVTAGVAPALVPLIAIGKAVDDVVPDLAKTVAGWIEGKKPTAEELKELEEKLSVLLDENNP